MPVLPKPKNTGPTRDEINDVLRTATSSDDVVPYQFARNILEQESSYNPMARSPTGAIGLMQLEPDTAKEVGVDPHDWKDNVKGGVAYIRKLLNKYEGNQILAAAAYNWGEGHLDRMMRAENKPDGKFYLPDETKNYIVKVVPDLSMTSPANTSPWPFIAPGPKSSKSAEPMFVLPPASGEKRQSLTLEPPGFQGPPSVDWHKDWRGIGSVLPGSRR